MFLPQSIQLSSHGWPIKIHLLSTGRIADKTRMRTPRFRGPAAMVDILIDHRFTEWLPVWVAVIEHPQGVFLIDTGMNTAVTEPGYFRPAGPIAGWFDSTQFRFDISPDQQLDRQLAVLNIPHPTAIVLTHLHFDHTGGLTQFPDTPVLINRLEWEHPHGPFYPKAFKPILLDLENLLPPIQHAFPPTNPLPPLQHAYPATNPQPFFRHTCPLTSNDDLFLVHTPGHTSGHSSVLLRTDTCHILLAGDICYDQGQLLAQQLPANLASRRLAQQTYNNVKAYARLNPLVFLPAHDSEAADRLHTLRPLTPQGG